METFPGHYEWIIHSSRESGRELNNTNLTVTGRPHFKLPLGHVWRFRRVIVDKPAGQWPATIKTHDLSLDRGHPGEVVRATVVQLSLTSNQSRHELDFLGRYSVLFGTEGWTHYFLYRAASVHVSLKLFLISSPKIGEGNNQMQPTDMGKETEKPKDNYLYMWSEYFCLYADTCFP